MAITNAQQFKQLVNPPMEGKKRPGYRGEAAAASDKEAGRNAGRSDTGSKSGRGDGPASRDFGGPGRDEQMGMGSKTRPGRNPMAQFGSRKSPAYEDFGSKPSTRNFNFMKDARRAVNPFGPLTSLPGLGGLFFNAITPNPFGYSSPTPVDFSGMDRGGDIPYWAKLGFNSEEEYLASLRGQAPSTTEQEPESVNPLSKLTPRIAGSQFAAAGGGIASLEDMDREGFLLGGIAKGLKKAVRGIKKLAKSPIGKAALGFAALKYGGGFGGLKTKFFGTPGYYNIGSALHGEGVGKAIASTPGILGKLGLTAGGGSMALTGKGVAAAIGIPSILAGLTTPKESKDKFDLDSYYASGQLNPSLSPRMMGSDFDFYGGRIASAEGGSTDKEPVAKKTMPLLDMGGKEMDLREEGGFVPIGRMEKADDVPARLSKNEFVFTADAVRNAGDGNVDKGAEVMYNMMKNLEAGGDVSEESQGLEGARKMFQTSQRLEEVL
jgi:hypothetical protein